MTAPVSPSQSSDRLPAEILSNPAWLYFNFPLRRGIMDELLTARRSAYVAMGARR